MLLRDAVRERREDSIEGKGAYPDIQFNDSPQHQHGRISCPGDGDDLDHS